MPDKDEYQRQMQPKLFARAEIYRILANVLIEKKPLPPKDWSVVKFDREAKQAGKDFDPDLFSRHRDALTDSIYYLADFANQMPERVNLSTDNQRVHEMCGRLADEIEQITYEPESVITRHGKLKSWLKAILAVQTCWIYREETDRVIADKEEAKRLQRMEKSGKKKEIKQNSPDKQWQSALAREILNKVSGRQKASQQPSLF